MSQFPQKDRQARTGSTLRRNPLGAHRKKLQQRTSRPVARLASEYQKACRKLLSRTDLKRVAAIVQQVKHEWHEASLKVGGDGRKLVALKDAARRKFRRLVAKAVPRYRKWQALHKEFQKGHRKLTGLSATGLHGNLLDVGWGELTVAPPPPGAVEFVPPFPLYDTQLLDLDSSVTKDDSFTKPEVGWLVNNIAYHRDGSVSWLLDGRFGLFGRSLGSTSLVSCGHAFVMPSTGKLQVNANVRNFWNKGVVSLRDRFGFSDGKVNFRAGLFIDIVQPDRVIHLPTTLIDINLSSDGDDVSQTVTDIDNSMLYQIVGTTDDVLSAGERVQIYVGSEVFTNSYLNDMDSLVNAVYWWQVRRIFAGVV